MNDAEQPTTQAILAERARAERELLGLSRDKVRVACKELGHEITEYGIILVEHGVAAPARAVDVAMLAKLYGVSTDYLLGLCEDPLGPGLHLAEGQKSEIEGMMRPGIGLNDFLAHVLRTVLMVDGERDQDILEKEQER